MLEKSDGEMLVYRKFLLFADMDSSDMFWMVPISSLLALTFAGFFFYQMKRQDEGNDMMKMIARHVRSGAMAYLRQQYKIVFIFFILITLLFAYLAYVLKIQNPWVPFAFISGGFFSGLAGYIGMKTALTLHLVLLTRVEIH